MPEMDGIETLRQIKQIDPNLDVIMVSAVDRAQEATDSLKLGACDYITKPFDHEIILNRVEKPWSGNDWPEKSVFTGPRWRPVHLNRKSSPALLI